ncbi:hypothetical protein SBI_06331 [Streptomyces bingchenggensis BCW-1]|uniref:Uncharacterized protein n=1 Tax=Streptomyces bingchenggensis (strain BCW-1) TaxID=749414 RepID=D7BSD3_STRBB|nr:hypothetical protein SBI_06331 [Streptomyces bingchenggensis BCW-1]
MTDTPSEAGAYSAGAALAAPASPRVKQAAIPVAASSVELSFFIAAGPFSIDPVVF